MGTYHIQGAVTDGDFTLQEEMSLGYEKAYFSCKFFSDAAFTTQVTPSAGTVTLTASPDGVNYITVDDGGVIPAATATTTSLATALGPMIKAKATLAGVTGAAYFMVTINRY